MAELPWTYQPQWLPLDEAHALFELGWETWPWQQGSVILFGKEIPEPRRSFFQADPGLAYTYAKRRLTGQGWLPELDDLRCRVNQALGTRFNSVLVNAYRDGRDYMGYHQDHEPELGPHPHVASISLGASRDFLFKAVSNPKEVHRLHLQNGSLLHMIPPCQRTFKHALPKRLKCFSPRINLTFRELMPQ